MSANWCRWNQVFFLPQIKGSCFCFVNISLKTKANKIIAVTFVSGNYICCVCKSRSALKISWHCIFPRFSLLMIWKELYKKHCALVAISNKQTDSLLRHDSINMLILQCVVCYIEKYYNQPCHSKINQLLVLQEYHQGKNEKWIMRFNKQ